MILVVVDTLRSDAVLPGSGDALGRFSPQRDTPFLSKKILEAHRFEYAHAGATMTAISMPSMFRSRPTHDVARAFGEPLGRLLSSEGLHTAAIVNNWIAEKRRASVDHLLDGFDSVAVYHKSEQDRWLELTRAALRPIANRPFFAWIHLYNMHSPGYAGRTLSEYGDGDRTHRYHMSLRWLDGQMKQFFELLSELELAGDTVVILASDHGEGLGDHGVLNHGPSVFNSQINTPLAIWMPGEHGKAHLESVGNVDIVPTILDLLGLNSRPAHSGHSLVTLFDERHEPWAHDYYARSAARRQLALIRGGNKLIYDRRSRVFLQYDLHADRQETRNLFDSENPLSRALVTRLMARDPGGFRTDVTRDPVASLLRQRLVEVTDATDLRDFEFLVQLATKSTDPQVWQQLHQLAEYGKSPERLLLMVRHVGPRDPAFFIRLVRSQIEALLIEDDARNRHRRSGLAQRAPAMIRGLAAQGQGPFEVIWAAEQLNAALERDNEEVWLAWLELTAAWPNKPAHAYAPALLEILSRSSVRGPAARGIERNRVRNLVLQNIAGLRRAELHTAPLQATARRLQGLMVSVSSSEHPALRELAYQALAVVGDAGLIQRLRDDLHSGTLDVRGVWACLDALIAVAGIDAARPDVRDVGRDQLMTRRAIVLMETFGADELDVAFLQDVAHHHSNRRLRKRAAKLVRKVTGDSLNYTKRLGGEVKESASWGL